MINNIKNIRKSIKRLEIDLMIKNQNQKLNKVLKKINLVVKRIIINFKKFIDLLH
jgi:hypothetical protein